MKPWEKSKRGWRFVKRGRVHVGDEVWCPKHWRFCRVCLADYDVKEFRAVRRKVKHGEGSKAT